jgi:hypothetical protein
MPLAGLAVFSTSAIYRGTLRLSVGLLLWARSYARWRLG